MEIKKTNSNDATPLFGKIVFLVNTSSTTPAMILKLHPRYLGDRASDFVFVYTSYKIKKLVFRFSTNTTSPVVLGVLDDIAGEGDNPTTFADVSELRSSMVHHGTNQPPTELYWEPVDKDLWYKTYDAGSLTSELYESGNTYLANMTSATSVISVEVSYELVFKGACDIGGLLDKLKREFNLVPQEDTIIVAKPLHGEQQSTVTPDRSGWYGTIRKT
jgi:hypothetical protein